MVALSTCRRPIGCGGAPGRVTSTRSSWRRCAELLAGERFSARGDQRLERLACFVGGLADGAALLGRELGDAAQDLRQLGLASQVAHAQLLERLAGVAAAIAPSASSCSWLMRSIMTRGPYRRRGRDNHPVGG